MTVLVAMPYFRHARYLDDAVKTVLGQTVHDIHVLVLGDGEEPPLHVRDDRVDVFTLPANHGAYFCHQLMVTANPHRWYAPVDTDDRVEPDHLEQLMAYDSDAVATGAVWFHRGDHPPVVYSGSRSRKAYFHVGLFGTERIRAVGGYDPTERVGQDTVMLRMLRVSGGLLRHVPASPTYHRMRRPHTLTTDPDTGHGSPLREATKVRNLKVYRAADHLDGAAAIRRMRLRRIPPAIQAELDEWAVRLRERIGEAVAA